MALDNENIANTYARFGKVIDHGKGAICYDEEGNKLIDFTAGIGVNSLGFCDPTWVKAVSEQAAKLQHVSNLYYSEPQVLLAKALTKKTGMAKVFFGNSGAEANECAIKAARKYGNDKSGNTKNRIITLTNSFHGRTVATITATGQEEFHKSFFPFTGGFSYCPAGDIDALEKMIDENTCAVMMEMIQGEGGVVVLDKKYVQKVAKLCAAKDVLLIDDEVQTGIGRTGTFFAYEQFGIQPDIVTFAKGIGGGLPIGGALFTEKTAGILQAGDHGTTFGGNPVTCAGALAVMSKMTPRFLASIEKKGSYIMSGLNKIQGVYGIDGMGLMIGFKVFGKEPSDVAKECLKQGLLVLTAHDKVRLLPPLVIDFGSIDKGLKIISKVAE